MAIHYNFEIAPGLTAEALVQLLVDTGKFEASGKLTAPDLDITLAAPSALKSELIDEAFDFTPGLELRFRINNLGDHDAAVGRILTSAATVFRHVPLDGALLMNGETLVLTRISGKLTLNEIPGFWSPARLALMPEGYSFEAERTI